ncbi:MAG: aldo/keto reductase [Saprospirales bacterium]|nr:aldo/keto reductase [Saprospirales bacterium]
MGLTRHIGVSNYNEERIKEMIDAGLPKPEANQVEFIPFARRLVYPLHERKFNCAPIAYSSLAPLSTWRAEEGQGGEVLSDIKKNAN